MKTDKSDDPAAQDPALELVGLRQSVILNLPEKPKPLELRRMTHHPYQTEE
jgi:hypothetical protein